MQRAACSEVAKLTAEGLPIIQRSDSDLARQLRRAVCSIPLNVGEGRYSRGKLRQVRYHTALGSAREVLACIEVALAIGYLRQQPLALIAKLNQRSLAAGAENAADGHRRPAPAADSNLVVRGLLLTIVHPGTRVPG